MKLDEFLADELDDQLNLVVSLEVPDEIIIKRITGQFRRSVSVSFGVLSEKIHRIHSILIELSMRYRTMDPRTHW
jgi:adenylate kinase family enzyme